MVYLLFCQLLLRLTIGYTVKSNARCLMMHTLERKMDKTRPPTGVGSCQKSLQCSGSWMLGQKSSFLHLWLNLLMCSVCKRCICVKRVEGNQACWALGSFQWQLQHMMPWSESDCSTLSTHLENNKQTPRSSCLRCGSWDSRPKGTAARHLHTRGLYYWTGL